MFESLWRGSLLPLGCEAALFVSASHSSGSKLPRHRFIVFLERTALPPVTNVIRQVGYTHNSRSPVQ
ncbi:hypothetical protein B1219_19765 [Pseudomonas ogarae]|nr:hypothetical protein B1219_19765 [Pseudomonas ogarae]OPG78639.1 hypothetical protein B1218_14415 [Pseudomonas ogarae]